MKLQPYLMLIIAIILLGACQPLKASQQNVQMSFNNPQTYTETYEFLVLPEYTSVRLRLALVVQAGSVNWRLYTPNDTVWENRVGADESFEELRYFEPVAGEWRLEIELNEAVGSYEMDWLATNEEQ